MCPLFHKSNNDCSSYLLWCTVMVHLHLKTAEHLSTCRWKQTISGKAKLQKQKNHQNFFFLMKPKLMTLNNAFQQSRPPKHCPKFLNIFLRPYKKQEGELPSECRSELWHRAQTLHCSIHVTGVTQVCQSTRQLHLKMTNSDEFLSTIQPSKIQTNNKNVQRNAGKKDSFSTFLKWPRFIVLSMYLVFWQSQVLASQAVKRSIISNMIYTKLWEGSIFLKPILN